MRICQKTSSCAPWALRLSPASSLCLLPALSRNSRVSSTSVVVHHRLAESKFVGGPAGDSEVGPGGMAEDGLEDGPEDGAGLGEGKHAAADGAAVARRQLYCVPYCPTYRPNPQGNLSVSVSSQN